MQSDERHRQLQLTAIQQIHHVQLYAIAIHDQFTTIQFDDLKVLKAIAGGGASNEGASREASLLLLSAYWNVEGQRYARIGKCEACTV
jgi:hypothetical protein